MNSSEDTSKFLYAAIADSQATIRATDAKLGVLMLFLAIPATKLGIIYAKIVFLLEHPNVWVSRFMPLLILAFAITWVISFWAAMRAIMAIDNPATRIEGSAQGVFYGAGLFQPTLKEILMNTPTTRCNLEQFIDRLPHDSASVVKELAFELAKLIYIRTIKMHRLTLAYKLGLTWIGLGAFIWSFALVLSRNGN